MNHKLPFSTTLSLLVFSVSLPATTLQNLETASALLRGPANMGALYSLTNDSPHAYRYKIAADMTRIANDFLSIANSNKDYKLQIPHFQQALRIVQASSNIIKTLATADNVDHHIPRHQQVLHALFLLETLAAGYVSQFNDDTQQISACQTYHNLHTLISQTQFITELLLEKEWNEAACLDGAFLAASLAEKVYQYGNHAELQQQHNIAESNTKREQEEIERQKKVNLGKQQAQQKQKDNEEKKKTQEPEENLKHHQEEMQAEEELQRLKEINELLQKTLEEKRCKKTAEKRWPAGRRDQFNEMKDRFKNNISSLEKRYTQVVTKYNEQCQGKPCRIDRIQQFYYLTVLYRWLQESQALEYEQFINNVSTEDTGTLYPSNPALIYTDFEHFLSQEEALASGALAPAFFTFKNPFIYS